MSTTDARLASPTRIAIDFSTVAAWAKAVVYAWTTRRAEHAMLALSDRMLGDLGLTRSEIARAVRGQAPG